MFESSRLAVLLFVALAVLAPLQRADALGKCTLGIFDLEDSCVEPLWDQLSPKNLNGAKVTKSNYQFKASSTDNIDNRKGFYVTLANDEYRAPIIQITFEGSPSAMIYVFEDDFLVAEFQPPFTSTKVRATGTGKWKLAVVIFNPVGESFDFSGLSVDLLCHENTDAFSNGVPHVCPTSTHSAGKCFYHNLGFNPWERWNAFTLAGASEFRANSKVQGRIASVGSLTVTGNAQIHTEKESFIAQNVPSWSISGGKGLDLTGAILIANGGVEAIGEIATSDLSTGKPTQIPDGEVNGFSTAMSADLSAAASYFLGRSRWWKNQLQSCIRWEIDQVNLELRIQVHGKLNIVNGLTADQVYNVYAIVLVGNPVGTVVINVADAEGSMTEIRVEHEDAEGNRSVPAFGRVLINFYAARKLTISGINNGYYSKKVRTQNKKQKSREGKALTNPPTHVSLLAPYAFVDYSHGGEMKGNLIASAVGVEGELLIQPFGTLAKKFGPKIPQAPRKWSNLEGNKGGVSKAACLWHNL